jgi:glycosyltransferase involved in cell wall biosynthesis
VVLHGETGLLVAPDDDAGLERALASLLLDPERARAMGERARARVARFDWERGTDALEAALARALEDSARLRLAARRRA